jgi:spermidine/putrescine transport system ATP-binding protein
MSPASLANPEGGRRPLVRLRGLAKSFGRAVAVKPTDLDIYSGDFFAILGPSGCGKTTLLRMIGGFVAPSAGTVEIDGADVTRLSPERRPTNMVFQSYGLFTHMTVRQNVAYGLQVARLAAVKIATRTAEILRLLRLEELADRPVTALSGGQQQRVALGRALILEPKVLLLDEPLAALDLKLRKAMHGELRRIHQTIGGTFILVSHDQGEVMSLADRVAVMEAGAVVQEGSPRDIYRKPATSFVSTFIGDANILAGRRARGQVTLAAGASFADPGPDEAVTAVVRPESVRLLGAASADVAFEAELADVIFFGPYLQLRFRLADGQEIIAHAAEEATVLRAGARVRLGWSLAQQRVLPA